MSIRQKRLSRRDALDLADLLALDQDLVAVELAAQICAQAARDEHETVDLELARDDLERLAQVFATAPALLRLPAFAHLNDEVLRELASARV